jgi:hypothetical protein
MSSDDDVAASKLRWQGEISYILIFKPFSHDTPNDRYILEFSDGCGEVQWNHNDSMFAQTAGFVKLRVKIRLIKT